MLENDTPVTWAGFSYRNPLHAVPEYSLSLPKRLKIKYSSSYLIILIYTILRKRYNYSWEITK